MTVLNFMKTEITRPQMDLRLKDDEIKELKEAQLARSSSARFGENDNKPLRALGAPTVSSNNLLMVPKPTAEIAVAQLPENTPVSPKEK